MENEDEDELAEGDREKSPKPSTSKSSLEDEAPEVIEVYIIQDFNFGLVLIYICFGYSDQKKHQEMHQVEEKFEKTEIRTV